ncbi:venom allergen 3-like isoform X2 [Drosophila hydei]|uniref:Venom allergen 3-like isoform X2 n=1 Tax=Drosophila hydei TaxID=7224 RepID=A0A6J2STA4_DROHY|nr:venom allergen 3-like isoform X2 [Drosophila hydei]XP_030080994.1 venom allergen 3-like isoform X2 [Drosophila hydei]
MKLFFLVVLLLQLQNWPLANAYNYCDHNENICAPLIRKHFICSLEAELPPLFNRTTLLLSMPDTYALRDLILEYHNKFRNRVASGLLIAANNQTFPPASRMRELIWDMELAYTARIHAKTVSFKHSLCRSVQRFRNVGENLSMTFSTGKLSTIADLLDATLLGMFNEYLLIDDPASVPNDLDFITFLPVKCTELKGSNQALQVMNRSEIIKMIEKLWAYRRNAAD